MARDNPIFQAPSGTRYHTIIEGEEENDPACGWLIDGSSECGEPDAPNRVVIKGKVIRAVVYLCDRHKKVHDESFARLRKRSQE